MDILGLATVTHVDPTTNPSHIVNQELHFSSTCSLFLPLSAAAAAAGHPTPTLIHSPTPVLFYVLFFSPLFARIVDPLPFLTYLISSFLFLVFFFFFFFFFFSSFIPPPHQSSLPPLPPSLPPSPPPPQPPHTPHRHRHDRQPQRPRARHRGPLRRREGFFAAVVCGVGGGVGGRW